MKKILKKTCSLFMTSAILFESLAPTIAFAVTYEDGNQIIIEGTTELNGDNFAYEHGEVQVTKNGSAITTSTFSVNQNDNIVITLYADENYQGKLTNGNDEEITLDGSSYSFTIGNASDSSIRFTPTFEEDESTRVITYDFRLNGIDFTNVSNGSTLTVEDDFNFDGIDEFYIKKIYINGTETYSYADNEYSYDLLDNQGRHIFEINASKTSDNYIKIRIQSHPSDIKNSDLVQDRNNYYEFYIPEINIKKQSFKGVEVTTNVMPDSYDFTTWNGVDLSATDKDNPGKVTVYYGENTINLLNNDIKKITLVSDQGVPENAVSIDNDNHTVTVLSNYYNEIPLKVELNDGTIGYINVNRIGIFIGQLNKGTNEFYHGASSDVGQNLNVDTDKNRIVGVFYHENTKTGDDYKLIVNLTYEDGSTETQIAQYVGDVDNSSGDIIGSDYILWKGNDNMPVKVSVTAVEADALTDTNTFGGATFGSGEGVVWEMD